MKLFIIGNGFDLHFQLPTSPSDFEQILRTKRSYDGRNAAEVISGYGVDWGKYEESLAYFAVDELAEDHMIYPDYLSDHERDRNAGITYLEYYLPILSSIMREAMREMVANANEQIRLVSFSDDDKLLINADSKIITFNYTSTIEWLYGLECFHIHGCYEKDDELVFGYKDELESKIDRELKSNVEEDHDHYIDSQKKMILEFYKSLKKRLRLNELRDYLQPLKDIDEVVVMGHSMSDVDAPYFELVETVLKPTGWTVYFHDALPSYGEYTFAGKVNLKHW